MPRQIAANGLHKEEIVFGEEVLRKIVQDYTREAGVRNLERLIGTEKFESEKSENIEIPGIATGLAVTAFGGDILFIEATRMRGKAGFTLNVHIHVPAGAVPKDGPSAGVALVLAIASLFSGRPVRSDAGVTGEITLRGRVLPVGGIKMKVLAAHRAGLRRVILPKRNERDLDDLPSEVRSALSFILIERIDEALQVNLSPASEPARSEVESRSAASRKQGVPGPPHGRARILREDKHLLDGRPCPAGRLEEGPVQRSNRISSRSYARPRALIARPGGG